MKLFSFITSVLMAITLLSTPVFAAGIGTTGSAKNIVTGDRGGNARSLNAGSKIFRNELVTTGAASAAQLLFKDRTTMTLGANAAVRLDNSVYSPSGSNNTVNAVKGAFRFISGIGKSGSYKINTPVASIGIRGSIVEGFIDENTGWEVFVLVQGSIEVCTSVECKTLNQPGSYIRVKPNGPLVGPAVWRGPYFDLNAGVNFVRNELHILLEPDQDNRDLTPPPPTGTPADGGGDDGEAEGEGGGMDGDF